MPENLEPAVLDAVANENFKVLGGVPAHTIAMSMQNAVSHQQAMNGLMLAAAGSVIRQLTEVGVEEAAAAAVLAQQGAKVAQSTPPETG